jgi:hypothetical protein
VNHEKNGLVPTKIPRRLAASEEVVLASSKGEDSRLAPFIKERKARQRHHEFRETKPLMAEEFEHILPVLAHESIDLEAMAQIVEWLGKSLPSKF